jgi:hypothetical protein
MPKRRKKNTPIDEMYLQSLARNHTERAIQTIAGVMDSGSSENVRVTAADILLSRGWGRPFQQVKHTGAEGGSIEVVIRNLMDEKENE